MAAEVLAEQIAARLRRDILRGDLPPGSSVKERDHAGEMGVSRTPMREAIRTLAKEGLLVLRPSRSPIVAQPTFKEISDKVEVLLALENLAVDLACRNATSEDFARIRKMHERMKKNHDTLDALDLFEIDMAFHTAIVEATHNDPLFTTYRSYLERLWRARYLSARQRRNREGALRHHGEILAALETRDVAAAKKAINAHLGNLAESIRPIIEDEQPH